MVGKVDHLDRAIVGQLQADGPMSSAEVARHIGQIAERAVRYRIERLTRDGVISVRAIVDPKALGFADIYDWQIPLSLCVEEASRS